MQTTHRPWVLGPGEHVCWQVRSPQEYAAGERELIRHAALSAGRLLIVGAPAEGANGTGGVSVLYPPRDLDADARPGAVLRAIHGQVHAARRQGQALRVLAAMEHVASPRVPLDELVGQELELAELAAESGTSVVCAYRQQLWEPALLGDLAVVHSRVVGTQPRVAGFRLSRADAGGWALDGSVGYESLRAFTAALRGALARSPRVQLRCERLELIDASALRALVETVGRTPGGSVVLDGANETVLGAWRMSGYGASGVAVEVCA
jgi:hypothetical protein